VSKIVLLKALLRNRMGSALTNDNCLGSCHWNVPRYSLLVRLQPHFILLDSGRTQTCLYSSKSCCIHFKIFGETVKKCMKNCLREGDHIIKNNFSLSFSLTKRTFPTFLLECWSFFSLIQICWTNKEERSKHAWIVQKDV